MEQRMEGAGPDETGPREFCDDCAQTWEVRAILPTEWERRSNLVRPDCANGWLLFTLGRERRRLAPLPPEWDRASEAQLTQWCADAERVKLSTTIDS
jgi:hypothetical protein